MNIKIKKGTYCVGRECYATGDVVTVSDAEGERLVKLGVGEKTSDKAGKFDKAKAEAKAATEAKANSAETAASAASGGAKDKVAK